MTQALPLPGHQHVTDEQIAQVISAVGAFYEV